VRCWLENRASTAGNGICHRRTLTEASGAGPAPAVPLHRAVRVVWFSLGRVGLSRTADRTPHGVTYEVMALEREPVSIPGSRRKRVSHLKDTDCVICYTCTVHSFQRHE
jgi:hypothetical protein